jgi:Uma2 family endonuclease
MVADPDRQYLTPEDYLDWEKQQSIKYEYIDGEVFAMTGGT